MSVAEVSAARPRGDIHGLAAELQEIAEEATKAFGHLSPAQLNWKPSAEQWSVGQCFDHLIVTNECFFPDLERIGAGTFRSSWWGRVSPLSGLIGRLVLKSLDPEKGRRTKAPRVFAPAKSDVAPDVISKFARHQSEAAGRMRAAGSAGADPRRTIVTSPVSPVATYSLLDACRIVVAHERRHFEQARRVTRSEGFPAE